MMTATPSGLLEEDLGIDPCLVHYLQGILITNFNLQI